ncbi:MAG: hypothetical protein WBV94_21820 [Blastocatellia bacterium]
MEERVRKVFLEADFKEALSLYEQVQTFALHLRGETKEIDPANGQTKQIHTEPLEVGRIRAAVALGLVHPVVLGRDGLSLEDRLSLRIRRRCTGDQLEELLADMGCIGGNAPPPEDDAPPILEAGTVIKLNGIPLELTRDTPVRGDVRFAFEQGNGPFTGDASIDPNADISRDFTADEATRDDSEKSPNATAEGGFNPDPSTFVGGLGVTGRTAKASLGHATGFYPSVNSLISPPSSVMEEQKEAKEQSAVAGITLPLDLQGITDGGPGKVVEILSDSRRLSTATTSDEADRLRRQAIADRNADYPVSVHGQPQAIVSDVVGDTVVEVEGLPPGELKEVEAVGVKTVAEQAESKAESAIESEPGSQS